MDVLVGHLSARDAEGAALVDSFCSRPSWTAGAFLGSLSCDSCLALGAWGDAALASTMREQSGFESSGNRLTGGISANRSRERVKVLDGDFSENSRRFLSLKLFGFIVSQLVVPEAHIENLGVHPHVRNYGIGSILIRAALQEFRHRSVSRVTLEVRESNEIALKLYRGMGFTVVGRRRNFYIDPHEDGLTLAAALE